MKLIALLISFVFFSTQIIPLKFAKQLLVKESVAAAKVVESSNDENDNENNTLEKNKSKKEVDFKFILDYAYSNQYINNTPQFYLIFNSIINSFYFQTIPTPPPNNFC